MKKMNEIRCLNNDEFLSSRIAMSKTDKKDKMLNQTNKNHSRISEKRAGNPLIINYAKSKTIVAQIEKILKFLRLNTKYNTVYTIIASK